MSRIRRDAMSRLAFEPLESRDLLDGTPQLVKDIYPGSPASLPTELAAFGDVLLFAADDGVNGLELWRSDGTEAGTYLLKDIRPGAAGSDVQPKSGFRIGDLFFFMADDGVHGPKWWQTDGTEAGTFLAPQATERPPAGDPCPLSLALYGVCYFLRGGRPWITDELGTRELNLPRYAGDSAVLRSVLLFTADDPVIGQELWRTDGTQAGTVLVKDTNPGPGRMGSDTGSEYWVVRNCSLFFANRERATGQELWVSNGTEEGTHRVRDIMPGVYDGVGGNSAWLVNVNGTVFFQARDYTHGYEIWKTDGTESGTELVADIWPGFGLWPQSLTRVNDKLFFVTNDGITGEELWVLEVPMVGDFDNDADVDHADIDLLAEAIRMGAEQARFDLTDDGSVDQADHDYLVRNVLGTRPGDTNLDCSVDERDVVAASPSIGAMDGRGWSDGDFNGDGRVDLMDLSSLQSQLDVRMPHGQNSPSALAAPAAAIQSAGVARLQNMSHGICARETSAVLRASSSLRTSRSVTVDRAMASDLDTVWASGASVSLHASRGRRLQITN